MRKNRNVIAAVVAMLFILPLMAACSPEPDRVTKENYDRLKLGMSFEEVSDILGEPATAATRFGLKEHTWVENDRHIHAKFIGDSALYYSSKNLEKSPPPNGTKTPPR